MLTYRHVAFDDKVMSLRCTDAWVEAKSQEGEWKGCIGLTSDVRTLARTWKCDNFLQMVEKLFISDGLTQWIQNSPAIRERFRVATEKVMCVCLAHAQSARNQLQNKPQHIQTATKTNSNLSGGGFRCCLRVVCT